MEALPNRWAKYFGYQHLPEHLQAKSKIFHDVFQQIVAFDEEIVDQKQLEFALQKLLETKDAFVRACLK